MAAAVDARSVRREFGDKTRSCRGSRRADEKPVAKVIPAPVGQIADRQNVLGVLLGVEFDAGIGQRGVIILSEQIAGGIHEDEQRIKL